MKKKKEKTQKKLVMERLNDSRRCGSSIRGQQTVCLMFFGFFQKSKNKILIKND